MFGVEQYVGPVRARQAGGSLSERLGGTPGVWHAEPIPFGMFTGIIEQTGSVVSRTPTPSGDRLNIDAKGWSHRPTPGDSIAVDGCCLTLAEPVGHAAILVFDVIPQTLSRTTLGNLKPGDQVHLEHAATPTTLLGGHIVQGHVDEVGEVVGVSGGGGGGGGGAEEWRVRIRVSRESIEVMVPRGSVCVQGVSLTLATVDVDAAEFEVALIPTTLSKTTLGGLRAGSRVNIEGDSMAKTVVHYLKHFASRS